MTLLEVALQYIDDQLASGTLDAEQTAILVWQRQSLLEDAAAEIRRVIRSIERSQVHEWEITKRTH
jgi:hypothetical protein